MKKNKWEAGWFTKPPEKEIEDPNYRRKAHEIPKHLKNVLPVARNMTELTMMCDKASKRMISDEPNPY